MLSAKDLSALKKPVQCDDDLDFGSQAMKRPETISLH